MNKKIAYLLIFLLLFVQATPLLTALSETNSAADPYASTLGQESEAQASVTDQVYGQSVTTSVYNHTVNKEYYGIFSKQDISEMKQNFTPEMWAIAVYYYPELLTYLAEQEQLSKQVQQAALHTSSDTIFSAYEQLTKQQLDALRRYTPLAEISYLRHKQPQKYAQLISSYAPEVAQLGYETVTEATYDAPPNFFSAFSTDSIFSSLPSVTDTTYKRSKRSLTAPEPTSTIGVGQIKPYTYKENTGQLVDPIYQTSNLQEADLHLAGRHGLDVVLSRKYNSMNAKVVEPSLGDTCNSFNNDEFYEGGTDCTGSKPEAAGADDNYIATGWELNLPTLQVQQQYDQINEYTVPGRIKNEDSKFYRKQFYNRVRVDASADPKDKIFPRLTFQVGDGSTYEFRDNITDQPFKQPYKHAKYTVSADQTYLLTLNEQITYEFKPIGHRWVISSITNHLGDRISYEVHPSKVIITDTVQRTIEVNYDTTKPMKRVQSIVAKDQSGVVINHIEYVSEDKMLQTTLRSYDPVLHKYEPKPIQAPYVQLNAVKDMIGNQTLKWYTYYAAEDKGIADFNMEDDYQFQLQKDLKTPVLDVNKSTTDTNGSESALVVEKDKQTYGEMAYLLVNQVTSDTGLTTTFAYSTYNPTWSAAADYAQRELVRGTTRNYLDTFNLMYIGYHKVVNVSYTYTDSDNTLKQTILNVDAHQEGKARETWMYAKESTRRLASSNAFRSGDVMETTFSTNMGDYTSMQKSSYKAGGFFKDGVFIPRPISLTYQSDGGQGLVNVLNTSDSTSSYRYAPLSVTSYKYEHDGTKDNTRPTTIYRFDSGAADDPRTAKEKDYLWGKWHVKPNALAKSAVITNIKYDMYGNIASEQDPLGNQTVNTYTGPKRQMSQTERTSVDGKQKLFTGYSYNPDGTLHKITTRSTSADITDNMETQFVAYNAWKQPIQAKKVSSGTQFGLNRLTTVTIWEYDTLGQHITRETQKVTLAEGQQPTDISVQYVYDARDRLTKQIDHDSSMIEYEYDYKNRPISMKWTPAGGEPRVTSYSYEDSQRIVTITHPDQEKEIAYYNPYGIIEKQYRQVGTETRTVVINNLNSTGQLIKETYPNGDLSKKTTFEYGKNGQILSNTDALGRTTKMYYANAAYGMNRPAASLQETKLVVEPDNKQTTTFYDPYGRVQKVLESVPGSAQTRTTEHLYNSFGKVTQTKTTSGAVSQTTKYGYDAAGNLVSLMDSEGQRYKYVYNQFGHPIATYMNGKLQAQNKYNEAGWLLTETNATGQKEAFEYASTGELIKHSDKQGQTKTHSYTPYKEIDRVAVSKAGAELHWTQYQYDPVTRMLAGIQNSEGETLAYSYDKWKRNDVQTVAGRKYSFAYDNSDNVTKVIFPDSKETQYTYDVLNRMTSVNYDKMGTVTYQYDVAANNNSYSIIYPNLLKQQFNRNAFKELTDVSHISGNTPVQWKETYMYDGFGNVNAITRGGQTFNYSYDQVNRIKREDYSTVSKQYSYDERGNRVSFEHTHMAVPELGTKKYTYNALNQLKTFSKGTDTTAYTYYGDSLRATKTVNGSLTRYVYLNGKVIEELDSSGNVKARNIWGNELLWRQNHPSGQDGYYYYNGHGDVVAIKDMAGNDLNTYDYDIWGNVLSQTGSFDNPFMYTGEIYDQETKLVYLRARYYDPSKGRFINEDTYKGELTNPLSLNLYTYAHNNPLIYADPSGHKVWLIHGTNLNGDKHPEKTWKPDFIDYVEELFEESSEAVVWSGGNTTGAREEAAEDLTNQIYDWHIDNPTEPIRLIGHSHGGNVAIMIANKLAERDMSVETLITIATPVREYKLETKVGQHIHVYNNYDLVQRNGGSVNKSMKAKRTFKGAQNVEVILPPERRKRIKDGLGISNHSIMHSNKQIWREYIQPLLFK
ncbi:RHS repeat domain-containing protein [Paenibacillus sp. 481]|uniref:RHS repeat domain-containing protein n=1 Tax=Paenibacillus sp. 481 TaxID=2835869 RepID=UPI001E3E9836|nr:RHS repeat-associated core domain-containing protein [Paenibacillus sp. 481]UHA71890.1 hypothetical protein KIK04_14215 [Paenibacillus sp. 481]